MSSFGLGTLILEITLKVKTINAQFQKGGAPQIWSADKYVRLYSSKTYLNELDEFLRTRDLLHQVQQSLNLDSRNTHKR